MNKQPVQKPEPYGYTGDGFKSYSSQRSPQIILDLILDQFPVRSALDVGCGIGNWSGYLQSKNVEAIGIDGAWVPRENVKLKEGTFLVKDITEKFDLARRFDLVLCLEVAEHMSEQLGEELLNNLVRHGDVIVFSAAIPGQGGFEHVNEQWPSYWVAKFKARGYKAFDLVRPVVWGNQDVKFYYQQNCFVAIRESAIPERIVEQPVAWDVVHPELYERVRDPRTISLKKVIKNLPAILSNYFRK